MAEPADPRTWEHGLVARMQVGDERALGEVYDQYAPLVHGIARRITGDEATAADVTQDVFVRLWENPDRFKPELGTLRTFLSVMTRRRSIDVLRRREAAQRREMRDTVMSTTTPPSVDEAATALVLSEKVRRAVEQLPANQREAVELAYFKGLSFREVAVHIGVPEGTAKSRLRLALARLASALREEGTIQWA